jgi:hypothetical protein
MKARNQMSLSFFSAYKGRTEVLRVWKNVLSLR